MIGDFPGAKPAAAQLLAFSENLPRLALSPPLPCVPAMSTTTTTVITHPDGAHTRRAEQSIRGPLRAEHPEALRASLALGPPVSPAATATISGSPELWAACIAQALSSVSAPPPRRGPTARRRPRAPTPPRSRTAGR